MVNIDAICLALSNPDYVVDVSYSSAVGTVTCDMMIEKEEFGGIWVLFDNFQATDEPSPEGTGNVHVNCGDASQYQTGIFRFRCKLTDSQHTTPEDINSFPPANC